MSNAKVGFVASYLDFCPFCRLSCVCAENLHGTAGWKVDNLSTQEKVAEPKCPYPS